MLGSQVPLTLVLLCDVQAPSERNHEPTCIVSVSAHAMCNVITSIAFTVSSVNQLSAQAPKASSHCSRISFGALISSGGDIWKITQSGFLNHLANLLWGAMVIS